MATGTEAYRERGQRALPDRARHCGQARPCVGATEKGLKPQVWRQQRRVPLHDEAGLLGGLLRDAGRARRLQYVPGRPRQHELHLLEKRRLSAFTPGASRRSLQARGFFGVRSTSSVFVIILCLFGESW